MRSGSGWMRDRFRSIGWLSPPDPGWAGLCRKSERIFLSRDSRWPSSGRRIPVCSEHGAMPVWSIHPVEEGWYGFPLLSDGTVKIAMDLHGDSVDPDVERDATPDFVESVREFVADRMPELAKGQMVGARACLYTNTPDGHFVIDWAPGSERIMVAGGGSGHGFKFGGAIGEVIADALENKPNSLGDFFRVNERFQATEQTPIGRKD